MIRSRHLAASLTSSGATSWWGNHPAVAPLTIHQYNLPSHIPVDPDPSDYDAVTNRVTLHDPGVAGGWVQINDCPLLPPCDEAHDFCIEEDGPVPCPVLGQYRKALEPGGTVFSWQNIAGCSTCKFHIERRDPSDGSWDSITINPPPPEQLQNGMSYAAPFGVAGARQASSTFRFRFQRIAGAPEHACLFDVYRP